MVAPRSLSLAGPLVSISLALAGAFPGAADGSSWAWPLAGEVVTAYDYRGDPYAGGQHRGVDIAAEPGTRVRAAVGGRVTFAGAVGSSGLTVTVRATDGRHDVSYLHLGSAAVAVGDAVGRGAPIGTSGTSGRGSAAVPHLHLGVRLADSEHAYRDPLRLLGPRGRGRDRPRGAPAPAPAHGRKPVRRPTPVGRPVPVRGPGPVRAPARVARPAARAWARAPGAPTPGRGGSPWAIACAALLLGAALAVGGRWLSAHGATGATPASSIGVRAVLRHHADLLRQR